MTNKIAELFNNWAKDGDDEAAEKEHAFAVFQVLDSIKWNKNDSYLDIGCGNGYTLRYVAKKIPEGTLLGLDFSEKMIKKAVQLSKNHPELKFEFADFTKWNPANKKFNKIFSMEAFYYFKDVQTAVTKTFGLLEQNGIFACVVDFYTENKASEEWPTPTHCNVPMQRHSKNEWLQFFKNAGFKEVFQKQIKYPEKLAKEPWQVEVGSLVTIGKRV